MRMILSLAATHMKMTPAEAVIAATLRTFGGVPLYNYAFSLPTPFQAQAGTEYWLQIEGYQNTTIPDWAWTAGTGADTRHFLRNNCNTGCTDHYATGDLAFTLLGTSSTTPPPPPPSGSTYHLYLPILRK